jgi:chromosome segregation ATPase
MQRFLTSLGADADTITLAQLAERDSTRGLADSKRDLIKAQERLRDLREGDEASLLDAEAANIEAQRRLVDAEGVGDAVALKRAKADLLRSEEALAKARNPDTAEALAEAEQDVAEAQDRVTRAEVDARKAREDLNRVINTGKDGSKDLAEANKAVEQAQRRVEQAERALVDANDALNTSTGNLGGTVRSANDQFLTGVSAADGWLQKLIAGKATPEEFAGAVGAIRDRLGDVAAQAGQTKELDDYLAKMQQIYDQIMKVDGAASGATVKLGAIPGFVGSSGGIGASAGVSQTVTFNIDGRRFGEVVVNGLIGWQDANGAIPIRVR